MCDVTLHGIPAQPAPGPVPTASRRRWLTVVAVAWAVLLVGLVVYAVGRGEPTVRAQTSVAHALPTADRAIAAVVTAAEPAGGVAEISGYREISARCPITAVRSGARYERGAYLYVPPGQESALLERIRASLPREYDARVAKSGAHQLTADAGDFVALRGSIVGAGEVRVTADTGCRPLTGRVSEAEPSAVAANRLPDQAVLVALKVGDVRWQTHQVPCARGGSIWTARADGAAGGAPASLVDALRAVSPAALLARPDLYVYRSGPVGVVTRARGGAVTVTATTGCGVR
jgi:hypothetical protein